MEAIRLIQKPENGRLIINVPDDMRNEALVIEFRPVREDELLTLSEVSRQLAKTLPEPNLDFDWNSLNVYDQ